MIITETQTKGLEYQEKAIISNRIIVSHTWGHVQGLTQHKHTLPHSHTHIHLHIHTYINALTCTNTYHMELER